MTDGSERAHDGGAASAVLAALSGRAPGDGEVDAEDALIVDVDGYEGPLDLLLALARVQKVDITKISILALAEQYLSFVNQARRLRLELAADYLVMAAWLAYLKSRLLLPEQEDDEGPSGEELAALLAFRLQKLEAMRDAAAKLMARNRLGRDVFARGAPEAVNINKTSEYTDNLYDLLAAYAARRQVQAASRVRMRRLPVWTIQEARERLERLVGAIDDWSRIDECLLEYLAEPSMRSTVLASSFSASLELVREGHIEIRQSSVFAPIFIRRKAGNDETHRRT